MTTKLQQRMAEVIAADIKRQFNGHPIPGIPESVNSWTATGGAIECEQIAAAILAMPEIRALVDAGNQVLNYTGRECWFDHNGNCQEHGISNPCEVKMLIESLAPFIEESE